MPRDSLVGSSSRCLTARERILSRCGVTPTRRHRTIDPDAWKIPARKGGTYTNGKRCFSISGEPAHLLFVVLLLDLYVCFERSVSRIESSSAQTIDSGVRSSHAFPARCARAPPQDATRTQNSMFGIRNLRKPRELSQPNQLDMVGERGFEPPTPWSRTRCSTRLSHSPTLCSGRWRNRWAP